MPAAWEIATIREGNKPIEIDNGQPKTLAVLVPHTGEVSTEWCLKFKNIQMPMGSQVFMSRGMPIDVTREAMVRSALQHGFEWIFFLDSDVIMPDDAIPKLLSHNQPFINGIYKAKKPGGFFWAAWMRTKIEGNSTVPDGVKEAFAPIATWDGRLISVDVIGTGCMLVHRSVFEKILATYPDLPLFFWTKDRNESLKKCMNFPDPLMTEVSEDFYFCLLAKKCGFQVVIDTEVKCGHISTVKIEESTVTLPGV